MSKVPARCVVTGGSGFVGQRLVEMLLERGAESVTSFDIAPMPADSILHKDPRVKIVVGDLRNKDKVAEICEGADCVWHNAAAVGPFHPKTLYEQVNYSGTLNIIEACKKHGVRKIVMSSSPSTRFTGEHVDGLKEDQLPKIPLENYLQEYARTKALGEKALTDACDGKKLLTVAVAPHQVYGPRDNLFLPNILEAGGTGRLRIFGNGKYKVSMTHVDNYCHGLIIAEKALFPGSPALGKFYIVTDMETHTFEEGYVFLWDELDRAVVGMGWPSIKEKMKLPRSLLMSVAWFCTIFTKLTGIRMKLEPFQVKMLTMHRWFNCSAAARDLGYKPIVSFREEWPRTIAWFREKWLPEFKTQKGITGLYNKTEEKIKIQSRGINESFVSGKLLIFVSVIFVVLALLWQFWN